MPKKGNTTPRGGRPKIILEDIDWEEIYKLCELQCTAEEIAGFMRISIDTLERKIQEKFNISFADFFAQKRVPGQISLRRIQGRLASENAAMAIFLGKNYLKQRDIWEIEIPNAGEYCKQIADAIRSLDAKTVSVPYGYTSDSDQSGGSTEPKDSNK